MLTWIAHSFYLLSFLNTVLGLCACIGQTSKACVLYAYVKANKEITIIYKLKLCYEITYLHIIYIVLYSTCSEINCLFGQ